MATTPSTSGAPAPIAPEDVWVRGPTVDLATLDDARLTQYRHPDERRMLLTIAGILAVITLVLALFGPELRAALGGSLHWVPRPVVGAVLSVLHPERFAGVVAIFLVAMALVQLFSQWLKQSELLSEAAEVLPTTFPTHYPALEELRRRFAMPTTRVFVYKAPAPKASSFGVREPYFIVFPSAVISTLTAEEFKFVLGREMGHIKLGHTRLAPLLGGGHLSVSGVPAWLGKIRDLITASYQRAQELSGDRIGVLATRDVRLAVDRTIKQAIMPPRGAQVALTAFTDQAAEVSRGLPGLANRLRQLAQPEPDLVFRLQALTRWAGLPPEPVKPPAEPVKPAGQSTAPTAEAAPPQKAEAPPSEAAPAAPAAAGAKKDGESAQAGTVTGEPPRDSGDPASAVG
jgi:Zn-dependent protease with chaperone function